MQPRRSAIGILTKYTGNYYFGAMLSSIYRAARRTGVPLVVVRSELRTIVFPVVGSEHVGGWIVIHPGEADAANLAALVATGVPVVTISHAPGDVACASVIGNDRGDTRALVHHLIDHGHRRIAYIDQGTDRWSQDRYQGYLDALHERGIAYDPSLVLDTEQALADIADAGGFQHIVRRGECAAQQLIARGMPCTALVASVDHSAIAAMRILQAAGYRVPEDLAVVGFDDIAEAQYAQPPLTTVRTRFDVLARTAAEYMLAVLRAERDHQPLPIIAPTALLRRHSCGCAGVEEVRSQSDQAMTDPAGWQTALAQQMVQVVSYPLAPDPGVAPTQIWPGVGMLIAALEAALAGQHSDGFVLGIEAAWQQAVTITENVELLHTAITLLEDAAEQRLATAPAARPAVTALLRQARLAMMRARLAYDAAQNQHLAASGVANQDISLALLSSAVGENQILAWLRKTPAVWGCLGLWADAPTAGTPAALTVVGVYQPESAPRIAIGDQYSAAAFPPFADLPLPAQQGHDLTILLPLRTGTDDLGVLALCGFAEQDFAFDTESLMVQSALLSATIKRDMLVRHLEDQAQVLAQARDAADAANQAKSDFLANISHELRTPLNGILGYAQLLDRAGDLNPQQAYAVQIIHQSGEHLLTLINDILDLAKIEAGKIEIVPTNIHFPSFLDGIVGIIRARAEAKQLCLSFDAGTSLPDVILADETRLRQVLLNLLGNAIKFTKRGGVTFRVSSVCEARDLGLETCEAMQTSTLKPQASSLIRFEVIDTGIGIAPDDLPRLFRPFEQIGAAWQRAEGTGLGLTISQHLVQSMGSSIRVQSQFGSGAAFWFDLVVPVVLDAPVANAPADRLIIGYTGPRRTILVADDNPYNRALLVDLLAPLGFMTLEAADGLSALEQAQAMRPDVILMDLLMPSMTGADATQAIRRIDALKNIVVIATSASVFDSDRQQSLLAGCDAFLPKPIQVDQLLALLMNHLNLTWRYAEAEPIPDARPAGTDQAVLLPPPEELATLFELATIGDLFGLQKRTIYLEQQNPQLGPFARRLGRLASRFEPEQILALLAQYLPPETEPNTLPAQELGDGRWRLGDYSTE